MGEITVILLLALIFLGPKRLPELASGLGKIIRDIRKATNDVKNEIQLDDAIRKPFEELRDAVTLHPEELKRRDRIRKDLEDAKRKAEADLAIPGRQRQRGGDLRRGGERRAGRHGGHRGAERRRPECAHRKQPVGWPAGTAAVSHRWRASATPLPPAGLGPHGGAPAVFHSPRARLRSGRRRRRYPSAISRARLRSRRDDVVAARNGARRTPRPAGAAAGSPAGGRRARAGAAAHVGDPVSLRGRSDSARRSASATAAGSRKHGQGPGGRCPA